MTIDALEAYGADTKAGLQICMNNESFYLRMVEMMPGDLNFQKLYDAVEAGNLSAAFAAAHALKGATGNLGLTPLFQPLCEITELLRARTATDYTALVGTIRRQHDALRDLCAQ